jgi:hypothetical protein
LIKDRQTVSSHNQRPRAVHLELLNKARLTLLDGQPAKDSTEPTPAALAA